MNSSSVKDNIVAASICIFCFLRISISFICFLNAWSNSFLCLSNFLLSSRTLSSSSLISLFFPLSFSLVSFSASLCLSNSSITLLSLTSFTPASCVTLFPSLSNLFIFSSDCCNWFSRILILFSDFLFWFVAFLSSSLSFDIFLLNLDFIKDYHLLFALSFTAFIFLIDELEFDILLI